MTKTWFITGSARGIGAAIARAALAAGDNVVATGRNVKLLGQAFASYGDRVLLAPLDVTDEVQANGSRGCGRPFRTRRRFDQQRRLRPVRPL
jgi:NAD(P)-dependent dehydrogenase (short-subunit alcohol dehydrogenase family)